MKTTTPYLDKITGIDRPNVASIRGWLAVESNSVGIQGRRDAATAPEYPWFGCKNDEDLLAEIEAELKAGKWRNLSECLAVMLHG